jgi:hypothetical protein
MQLENQIAEWRKQMLAAGIKFPVPLEELEIHLREEIERQMKTGLSEQNAFEISIQKIGSGNSLNDEFKKIRPTKEERDWKLKQWLFGGCLAIDTLLVGFIAASNNHNELNVDQRASILAATSVMNALVIGGRLGYRFFPVISSKRLRGAICGSVCAVLITILIYWFNFVLPQHDYTIGQMAVAVLWSMMLPIGVSCGLIAGIETAAWKNSEHNSSTTQN